ncbi:MAG: hypothetical protein PVJ27_11605 [Candidatus Brocadiaceae bacterium]|jgi:hypothetical protein
MTTEEQQKEIRDAVREAARDGRIECAKALALARDFDVAPLEIGRACNSEGIKIARCQLGCFR